MSGPMNINTAPMEELQSLKGIGEKSTQNLSVKFKRKYVLDNYKHI
jgi:DNA uptake protein ComE-like DNA-binding protein